MVVLEGGAVSYERGTPVQQVAQASKQFQTTLVHKLAIAGDAAARKEASEVLLPSSAARGLSSL